MPTQNVYMEINKKSRNEPLARSAPTSVITPIQLFWPSQTVPSLAGASYHRSRASTLLRRGPSITGLHDPVISGCYREVADSSIAAY
jgi:hypothetical protein